MCEVKRYYTSLDHGTYSQPKYDCNDEVVKASDFDRVTAERDALQLRLNAADQRVDDLEGQIERRKLSELAWSNTASDMCRGRSEALKKVAEGMVVTVFKTPAPMDVLEQLMPCEVFQLDGELLVLHSATKPNSKTHAPSIIGIEPMPAMEYDEP